MLVVAVDEVSGGEDEAVEGLGVMGVVGDRWPTGDLRRVVQAALHVLLVVVEDLIGIVVGDRGRERDGQTAPRIAGLLPRVDLFGFDVGIGEDEGGGEVVPYGAAHEVGDLNGVPGRAAGVEREASIVSGVCPLDAATPALSKRTTG